MSEAGFSKWRVTCQVSKLISVTGVFGDLVGIFGIALERFIYITFPLQYETLLTRGRVVAMLVMSWTTAVCFSVLGVVFSNVEIRRGETCEVRNVYSQTQTTIGFIPCVVAVLIIVAVLYVRIGQIAYRASRDINRVGTLGGESTNQNGAYNQNNQSKLQMRITSVLSLVIGVFVVTYIPSMIVLSLAARLPTSYSMGWILAVAIVVWNINTFSNPIIYAWKNMEFKKAFYILLKRKLPQEVEQTGSGNT